MDSQKTASEEALLPPEGIDQRAEKYKTSCEPAWFLNQWGRFIIQGRRPTEIAFSHFFFFF